MSLSTQTLFEIIWHSSTKPNHIQPRHHTPTRRLHRKATLVSPSSSSNFPIYFTPPYCHHSLSLSLAMTDPIKPSTSRGSTVIHPRREPFEFGLLPIPKLIFSDPTQSLITLKQKLLDSSSNHRVDSATISDSLQISADQARLLLDTLASVHHSDSEPLVRALPGQNDAVGADIHDLVLLLYIQSYKRLLPRSHKDSASVADVWPSTSAFDGYFSALSPLQVKLISQFQISILAMQSNA